MKIAVIPARGGSKRIPKKNIKNFCGQPIISLAIRAAQKTKIFDKIIVSTDSKIIAKIARKYRAEVPFLRPKKLSDDKTGTAEVIAHAIKWLKKNNYKPTAVCCIYPTSALIFPKDIKDAYKKFSSGKWNYVFSATSFVTQIQKAFQKNKKRGLKMFFPKMSNKRSQDFKKAYHDAALFYWGKPESWIKNKKIYSKNSAIKYIPRWRACDIDTFEDWEQAEIFYKSLLKKNF